MRHQRDDYPLLILSFILLVGSAAAVPLLSPSGPFPGERTTAAGETETETPDGWHSHFATRARRKRAAEQLSPH